MLFEAFFTNLPCKSTVYQELSIFFHPLMFSHTYLFGFGFNNTDLFKSNVNKAEKYFV